MTRELKMKFDSIELDKVIQPMFSFLYKAIEHALENMDEEVSSLDIVDYIQVCMKNQLEERGELNEEFDIKPLTLDEIISHLENESSYTDIMDYLNKTDKINKLDEEWTLEDWEEDFRSFISDQEGYLGDNYISEEEMLQERLIRNAGL